MHYGHPCTQQEWPGKVTGRKPGGQPCTPADTEIHNGEFKVFEPGGKEGGCNGGGGR